MKIHAASHSGAHCRDELRSARTNRQLAGALQHLSIGDKQLAEAIGKKGFRELDGVHGEELDMSSPVFVIYCKQNSFRSSTL